MAQKESKAADHGHASPARAEERARPERPGAEAPALARALRAAEGAQGDERDAAIVGDERAPAAVRADSLRQIQQVRGNAYAQRVAQRALLQRGPITSWLETQGHNLAEAVGLEDSFDANLGRADAFRDHGPFGPEDVTPGGGGFEVTYDPAAGVMRVVVRAAVTFQDALTVTGGTITPADPRIQSLANAAANPALTPAQRAAFIARYQWSPAEKIPWMNQFENGIQTAWGGQHQFFINRPQWEWLGARVHVDIEVREGERADGDHLAVNSVKMPAGEHLATHGGTAEVSGGVADDAGDQTMLVASTDVNPRHDNFLRRTVHFAHNSAALDGTATATLDSVANIFQEAVGDARSNPAQIVLEAHASAPGDPAYNMQLAQQRADAVRSYLAGKGFTNIATRVSDDNRGESEADQTATTDAAQAHDRRVDLIIDGGQAQVIANHEFGHAIGLGDEYATSPGGISGTGAAVGTPAPHDALAADMTDASGLNLPGAIHENNGGIMSLGTAVRPQHYATFHDALQTVTGIDEWSLGAPRPRPTRPPASGGGTAGP